MTAWEVELVGAGDRGLALAALRIMGYEHAHAKTAAQVGEEGTWRGKVQGGLFLIVLGANACSFLHHELRHFDLPSMAACMSVRGRVYMAHLYHCAFQFSKCSNRIDTRRKSEIGTYAQRDVALYRNPDLSPADGNMKGRITRGVWNVHDLRLLFICAKPFRFS